MISRGLRSPIVHFLRNHACAMTRLASNVTARNVHSRAKSILSVVMLPRSIDLMDAQSYGIREMEIVVRTHFI